ncbi:hypothetical protein HanIR_Chr06g0287161 [Helianthus annuus]|nr:hypothetical protein HanIR_Chr06g0287161 [Helianthus annuus]
MYTLFSMASKIKADYLISHKSLPKHLTPSCVNITQHTHSQANDVYHIHICKKLIHKSFS